MRRKTEAARGSGNCHAPKQSASTDKDILTDYERTTMIAGLILGIMFGIMSGYAAVAL